MTRRVRFDVRYQNNARIRKKGSFCYANVTTDVFVETVRPQMDAKMRITYIAMILRIPAHRTAQTGLFGH